MFMPQESDTYGFFVAVLADKNDSISLLSTSPINRNKLQDPF